LLLGPSVLFQAGSYLVPPSHKRLLEPVGEHSLLAEDLDGGIGERQPTGRKSDVGFAEGVRTVMADGVYVTSNSSAPPDPR
jgi:hypothetical protein